MRETKSIKVNNYYKGCKEVQWIPSDLLGKGEELLQNYFLTAILFNHTDTVESLTFMIGTEKAPATGTYRKEPTI